MRSAMLVKLFHYSISYLQFEIEKQHLEAT
jgi:hypothetical protein